MLKITNYLYKRPQLIDERAERVPQLVRHLRTHELCQYLLGFCLVQVEVRRHIKNEEHEFFLLLLAFFFLSLHMNYRAVLFLVLLLIHILVYLLSLINAELHISEALPVLLTIVRILIDTLHIFADVGRSSPIRLQRSNLLIDCFEYRVF